MYVHRLKLIKKVWVMPSLSIYNTIYLIPIKVPQGAITKDPVWVPLQRG
jgi:hypothetical protein